MNNSNSDKPKKKRKSSKIITNTNVNTKPIHDKISKSDIPLNSFSGVPTAAKLASTPENDIISETLANILQNEINKYANVVDKYTKETRSDFECLQPIISEFLEDFIIIGHTLDGQRVVIRYTATPADLDKLTELCKKVLVRMLIQEQNGE